jgi:hypothetical protein
MIQPTRDLLLARRAKEVAERRNDEAALRSAISRAYYPAFHIASNHRGARGALQTRQGSHQAIWYSLLHSNVPNWRSAAIKGKMLMGFRVAVDYRDDVPNLQWIVWKAINTADDILRLLNS